MNLKMTEKGRNYRPTVGRNENTNIQSWGVVSAMFQLRESIPFEDLVVATKGHIHGTQADKGKPSSVYINWLIKAGYLQ